MSVKVNLLPADVRKREAAGRAKGMVAAGFLVLAGALGVAYWLKAGEVADARVALAAEEQEVAALQAELAELAEFGELQARRDDAVEIVTIAMSGEASYAGMLQDVAAVMPPDAELSTLSLSTGVQGDPGLGDEVDRHGTMLITGRSVQGHAPGLERFLLEFDKVAAFSDVYFTSSQREEIDGVNLDVVAFSVEVDLGPEVLTGRYADGLPEALR